MKLLLCLCLIFCFKTAFSQITCYICEPTNVNNPQLNKCLAHNRLNLVMCCADYQFNCGRYIGYTNPIPEHLFHQNFPHLVSNFQNTYVSNPLNVLQQPNYGIVVRSFSTGRYEPRPYAQPEEEFLNWVRGHQFPYNNRNVPSNGFGFPQNNPQPYYPRGPNFPHPDTESIYPRPAVPFQQNHNFPRGPSDFYDNNNNNGDSNYGSHVKNEHHTQTIEVVNGIPRVKQYSFIQNDTDTGGQSFSHTKKHDFESVNGVPVVDKTTVNEKQGGSPYGDGVDAEEESQAEFNPVPGNNYQQPNQPSSRSIRRTRSPQNDQIPLADTRKQYNSRDPVS